MERVLAFSYPVTFPDNQFWITGSSDATKTIKFEVDAQSTGADLTISTGAQTADRSATFPVMTGSTIVAVSDTTLTPARVPFATTNGILTDSANMTYDGSKMTLAATSGNQLDLIGVSASFGNGPDMRLKFSADSDAVFSFFAYSHDNIALVFDAYFNGSNWIASNTSAFQIYKASGSLVLYADSGLTKGNSYTPTPRITISAAGAVSSTSSIVSTSATLGVGYATGAGGAVTQITSRTTGVTLNKICGAITLVSAAGSATWQSFTVTNSAVAATDTVIVNQKSGTDLYIISVTNVAAGSFRISFATTGGTTSEQPVFNFSVIKAVAA